MAMTLPLQVLDEGSVSMLLAVVLFPFVKIVVLGPLVTNDGWLARAMLLTILLLPFVVPAMTFSPLAVADLGVVLAMLRLELRVSVVQLPFFVFVILVSSAVAVRLARGLPTFFFAAAQLVMALLRVSRAGSARMATRASSRERLRRFAGPGLSAFLLGAVMNHRSRRGRRPRPLLRVSTVATSLTVTASTMITFLQTSWPAMARRACRRPMASMTSRTPPAPR
ncbi:unnamed protein product [Prorocentrum cordatum]|uniref:Uncharacterized protein n=1 Tax=Prorocentrum cordatum TaxID=2364126 RepID=A0ABN9SE80_9DINO|nr:unnamed protein product [Polarella glacialis]